MTEWTKERIEKERALLGQVLSTQTTSDLLDEIERLQGELDAQGRSLRGARDLANDAAARLTRENTRLRVELEQVKGEKSLFAGATADNAEAIRQAVEQEREECAKSQDELAAAFMRKAERAKRDGERVQAVAVEMQAVALTTGARRIRNRSQEGR